MSCRNAMAARRATRTGCSRSSPASRARRAAIVGTCIKPSATAATSAEWSVRECQARGSPLHGGQFAPAAAPRPTASMLVSGAEVWRIAAVALVAHHRGPDLHEVAPDAAPFVDDQADDPGQAGRASILPIWRASSGARPGPPNSLSTMHRPSRGGMSSRQIPASGGSLSIVR